MSKIDSTFSDTALAPDNREWFLNLHTGYPVQSTAQKFIEQMFMEVDGYRPSQDPTLKARVRSQASVMFRQASRVLEASMEDGGLARVQDSWDILCGFQGFNFSQVEFEAFVRKVTAHPRVALAQVYFDTTKPPVLICGPRASYKEPFSLLPDVWIREQECDSSILDSCRPLYADIEQSLKKERILCVKYAYGVDFTTMYGPLKSQVYNVECIEADGSYNRLILDGPSLHAVAHFAAMAVPGREVVKVELRK